MSSAEADKLATYIMEWLECRNNGELRSALQKMRVGDYRLLLEELSYILQCGGKPINWL